MGFKHQAFYKEALVEYISQGDTSLMFQHSDIYTSFTDWPWNIAFREMDEKYPGSKFILTTRISSNAWYESLCNHAMSLAPKNNVRKLIFGHYYPFHYKQSHIETYQQHNEAVRQYFANRPDDFIELCWEKGDGWNELCRFLGMGVPAEDFPWLNKTARKNINEVTMMKNRLLSHLLK